MHPERTGLEGHSEHEDDRDQPRWIIQEPGRPAPEAGAACFWSPSDLIECTDGKSRRVEPQSFGLAHGLPKGMDDLWHACRSEIKEKVIAYAKATNTDPNQTMREMRKALWADSVRGAPGRQNSISPQALLFSALCELKGQLGNIERGAAPRFGDPQEAALRELRAVGPQDQGAPCSPYGWKYPQQLADELADVMRKLPPEAAYYFFDGFPLIGKIVGRVALLRGFGNAINPLQAAIFIQACEESMNAETNEPPTPPAVSGERGQA